MSDASASFFGRDSFAVCRGDASGTRFVRRKELLLSFDITVQVDAERQAVARAELIAEFTECLDELLSEMKQ